MTDILIDQTALPFLIRVGLSFDFLCDASVDDKHIKNKYFLLILALYLAKYMGSGLTSGLGIYFATYQLGNASLLGTLSLAGILPSAIALPFVPLLTSRFGMSKAVMASNIVGALGCIPVVIGGLTGNFTLVLIGMAIRAVASAPQTGAMNAIIAETDEYSHLKFV